MLRVTTLYASSASATAAYYTRYLARRRVSSRACGAVSRRPRSACPVGSTPDDLQALLEGRDPTTGDTVGQPARRPAPWRTGG